MADLNVVKIRFKGTIRDCIAGQLIVKVDPSRIRTADAIQRLIANSLGPTIAFNIVVPFDARGVGLIEFDRNADLESLAAKLERTPDVLYAEPNDATQISDTPSVTPADPLFEQQWSLLTIQAPATWGITQGADDVVIAVLDTGIAMMGNPPSLSHEDLSNPARFFTGGNHVSPDPTRPPLDDQATVLMSPGLPRRKRTMARGLRE